MTVDHVESLDIDHLVLWSMGGPDRFAVPFGEIALFGDGVGHVLESLGDFLAEVQ